MSAVRDRSSGQIQVEQLELFARIGVPDEIAGAAVLLGSKAGDFMTGQTVVIDGGATIS